MEKKRVSVFNIILTIIEIAAVLLAVARFAAPKLFDNFRPAMALVVSDSMQPVLTPGTVVGLKGYHEGDELNVGDIITYLRKDGKTIIHRVKEIGDDYVITKGDNNSVSDPRIEMFRIRGIVTRIHRVGNEKIQSIVRNYYAKDNNQTRQYVSIGIVALAVLLLISSFIPDKKERQRRAQEKAAAAQSELPAEPAAPDTDTTGKDEP